VQRDLVVRAQGGDHDAFSVLAGAAIGRLDSAARLILRDADLAQDAVQETLIRCWRDLPTLRDPERFEAWLNRIFLRACRAQQRRVTDAATVVTTGFVTTVSGQSRLRMGT
jgi:RNA polymerase sigma-70 factor, ECF subfamily